MQNKLLTIFQSQLTTIKQYPYLTQALPISCMSKACFDKLRYWAYAKTNTYIQSKWCQWQQSSDPLAQPPAPWNSPEKFQQQFIVCKHLLCPIILGLEFFPELPHWYWLVFHKTVTLTPMTPIHCSIRFYTLSYYTLTRYLHCHHHTY